MSETKIQVPEGMLKAAVKKTGERFWSFHKSFEAAVLARKEMERIHHGEFARA